MQVYTEDGMVRNLMLMVDTGFVGADIMLSAKSSVRLGLADASWGASKSGVESLVGIGRTPVDVVRCSLSKVRICGHDLFQVDALCSTSCTDLQTPSIYADGYVGMGLLGRYDLWLDVMHERIALETPT